MEALFRRQVLLSALPASGRLITHRKLFGWRVVTGGTWELARLVLVGGRNVLLREVGFIEILV